MNDKIKSNPVHPDDCRNCPKLGVPCVHGFFRLSAYDVLEKCKQRKAERHISIAKLAEDSGVPEGTVARLFSGNANDPKYDTLVPIALTLFPEAFAGCACCGNQEDITNDKLYADLAQAEDNLLYLQRDFSAYKTDAQKKIDFLKEQIAVKDRLLYERNDAAKHKDRIITLLFVCFSIAALIIIVALIVDRMNHDIGFFWLDPSMFSPSSAWQHITEILGIRF